MVKFDEDSSSASIASSDSTHKPCDRSGPEQSAENTCADMRMVVAD